MESVSHVKSDGFSAMSNSSSQSVSADSSDFIQAYDAHAPALYRFALFKVNSRELAEDLVSQTFLQTWQYLSRGEHISAWKMFLFRTINNLIVNHYRRKHLEPILVDERTDVTLATIIDERHLPNVLNRSLESRSIIEAFNLLPQEQKEILLWRFVDDMSIEDIAHITGKNKSAIYVSIHRSMKKMHVIIKEGRKEEDTPQIS